MREASECSHDLEAIVGAFRRQSVLVNGRSLVVSSPARLAVRVLVGSTQKLRVVEQRIGAI